MKHFPVFFSIIVIIFSVGGIKGQENLRSTDFEILRKEILENPYVQKGQVSWCFRDIQTGQIVEEFESKKYMIPASTLKLFTTAAALELGTEFNFKNSVVYTGEIKKEKLNGDVIIKGDGDPTFGSGKAGALSADSVLFYIYKSLIDNEIKKIKGNIVVDPFHWEYNSTVIPAAWQWEDIANYYGAGAYGLNWRENKFEVRFGTDKERQDSAIYSIQKPWDKFIKLENNVTTILDANSNDITFYGAPFENKITADGFIKIGDDKILASAALPNPPLNFGQELKEYLVEKGIEIEGEVLIKNTTLISVIPLRIFLSPPMRSIIKEINFNSNNLFAECVAKKYGERFSSGNASKFYSKSVANYVFDKTMKKDSFIQITDGSGLSRTNLVSTRIQTDFLRVQSKMSWFGYYLESIPKGGEEGTVKYLPKLRDFRVKSGSVNKVKAFTGYIMDSSGRQMSFSLIFNHIPLKNSEINKMSSAFFTAVGNTNFEIPLKVFGTNLYRDTLERFPEIIAAKEELKKNAAQFFSNDEMEMKLNSEKFTYSFQGEPDVESPYFIANAVAGGELYQIKFKYRIHAENRFAERWNTVKNEWEMICWGDVFYKH